MFLYALLVYRPSLDHSLRWTHDRKIRFIMWSDCPAFKIGRNTADVDSIPGIHTNVELEIERSICSDVANVADADAIVAVRLWKVLVRIGIPEWVSYSL